MLENSLKELGTMLVKAGNTIERQKEEIERLRWENQMLKNGRNVIPKKEFIEKLEKEISESMSEALKCSKLAKDENNILERLNAYYYLGQHHAYHFLIKDLDRWKFVELLKKYNSEWLECQDISGLL